MAIFRQPWQVPSANIPLMQSRKFNWRVAAGLTLVSTAADGTLGALFLMGFVRTVSFRTLQAIYWIPPVLDRATNLLRHLAHLNTNRAWMVLLLMVILGMLLARGLWKEKLWAGWVETALMFYIGISMMNNWRVAFAGTSLGVRDFFMIGSGPALVWAVILIGLLWSDQVVRFLHRGRSEERRFSVPRRIEH